MHSLKEGLHVFRKYKVVKHGPRVKRQGLSLQSDSKQSEQDEQGNAGWGRGGSVFGTDQPVQRPGGVGNSSTGSRGQPRGAGIQGIPTCSPNSLSGPLCYSPQWLLLAGQLLFLGVLTGSASKLVGGREPRGNDSAHCVRSTWV